MFVCLFVCLFVCWLVCWLVSQQVSFLSLFHSLLSVCLQVGLLVSQSVSQLCLLVCLFAFGQLISQTFSFVSLFICLFCLFLMTLTTQYTLRSSSLRHFLRPFFTGSNCSYALQNAVLRHLQSAFSPQNKRPGVPSKPNCLQYNTTKKSKQHGFPIQEMPVSKPDPVTSHSA